MDPPASPAKAQPSQNASSDAPQSYPSPDHMSPSSSESSSEPSSQAQQVQPLQPSSSPSSSLGMTASSTPLGSINAARRPAPPQPTMSSRGALPQDLQARLKAFHLGRQGAPPNPRTRSDSPQTQEPPNPTHTEPASPPALKQSRLRPGGIPSNFQLPSRPGPPTTNSSPEVPSTTAGKPSLATKRGMALPGGLPGSQPAGPSQGGKKKPGLTLSQMNSGDSKQESEDNHPSKDTSGGSLMDRYSDFIDKKTGSLKFKGKATLTPLGVEFTSGSSFNISLDEVDTLDELGKGNYGTVYKVRHSRPRVRKPGQGLAGNKSHRSQLSLSASSASPHTTTFPDQGKAVESPSLTPSSGTSGIVMAMKEIRLELDDAKFAAIIMELDILHRCVSPFIIDFYGAFFQEGAVYICIEFMDGGSIDRLYGDGVPENVLRKITLSTTMGLKALKDEHNIIHRDVKPTNILVNTRGQVKICDFGVSGNLVASIAKTNIGCQSYMAPERISSGGVAQAGANPGGGTYSVQSDIWSLGLTIIECALGQYPYPPETYDNIFSQLSAIVEGDPPDLPKDSFSPAAHDFVQGCLMKIPKLRPTYAMLLQHAWLAPLLKPPTISEEDEESSQNDDVVTDDNVAQDMDAATADREVAQWVQTMLERRKNGTIGKKAQPALHAAPLDAMSSPVRESRAPKEA